MVEHLNFNHTSGLEKKWTFALEFTFKTKKKKKKKVRLFYFGTTFKKLYFFIIIF